MDILRFFDGDNLVCGEKVLSFLEVNDLLRLRRVSKSFKDVAEDYIRSRKVQTKREIKIVVLEVNAFEKVNRFGKSLNHLPIITRVHLDLRGPDTKVDSLIVGIPFRSFLDTFGIHITNLTLSWIRLPLDSEGMIKSFPNVIHLKLQSPKSHCKNQTHSSSSAYPEEIIIPACLKKLQTLSITRAFHIKHSSVSSLSAGKAFSFLVKLVESNLSSLEQLEFPFGTLLDDELYSEEAVRLAHLCLFTSPNLKLVGVDEYFFENLLNPENSSPETGSLDATRNMINTKIMSIRNPSNMSFLQELPNLVELEFAASWNCRMPERDAFVRQDWSKLKEIKVDLSRHLGDHESWYDSDDEDEVTRRAPAPLKVWDFLFGGDIRRDKLEELLIVFEGHLYQPCGGRRQILQRTNELLKSSPNIRTLYFVMDIKSLVNLPNLWKALPLLEKVTLDGCINLKNSDFFGNSRNAEDPAFLNLKRLKEFNLYIEGENVTDKLLRQVICKMPLKNLVLKYCPSITSDGIRSLIGGVFASSIERLNISDLSSVSEKRKKALANLFRSSKMI